ncbi:MAG: hypothetical protein AVDCRST_MAG23-1006 [uncultured Sphingosinicella sp.]|uniref:Uncharacterized protein n=1 Tax=uncultured Sphingosinicella sp. TaxID=478748 RepID=A0A6J4TRU3_9SPHN|nr:MAG: hypothetical protein AVDCRST_MAG23-1006 [uncultured Sphingosinicella sp.]
MALVRYQSGRIDVLWKAPMDFYCPVCFFLFLCRIFRGASSDCQGAGSCDSACF